MISSEVQRTLVKSPPELWSELSDPATLGRHLGELGEIRITRVKPEQTIEWEAENTTGTVAIKPSGWGTRVTLTVNREMPEAQPAAAADEEPVPTAEPEPESSAESERFITPILALEPDLPAWILSAAASERTADPPLGPHGEPLEAPEPASEPEPESEPMPRRGFFARLFGRRRREQPAESEPGAVLSITEPEPVAKPEFEPDGAGPATEAGEAQPEPSTEPPPDISRELREAEEIATEAVTAVLTGVLDRLGAAHHRPFSRS
jgi:hypothetical protein